MQWPGVSPRERVASALPRVRFPCETVFSRQTVSQAPACPATCASLTLSRFLVFSFLDRRPPSPLPLALFFLSLSLSFLVLFALTHAGALCSRPTCASALSTIETASLSTVKLRASTDQLAARRAFDTLAVSPTTVLSRAKSFAGVARVFGRCGTEESTPRVPVSLTFLLSRRPHTLPRPKSIP